MFVVRAMLLLRLTNARASAHPTMINLRSAFQIAKNARHSGATTNVWGKKSPSDRANLTSLSILENQDFKMFQDIKLVLSLKN